MSGFLQGCKAADVRFVDEEYLSIDQATLTGESLPVSKKVGESDYSRSIAKKGFLELVSGGHLPLFVIHSRVLFFSPPFAAKFCSLPR